MPKKKKKTKKKGRETDAVNAEALKKKKQGTEPCKLKERQLEDRLRSELTAENPKKTVR